MNSFVPLVSWSNIESIKQKVRQTSGSSEAWAQTQTLAPPHSSSILSNLQQVLVRITCRDGSFDAPLAEIQAANIVFANAGASDNGPTVEPKAEPNEGQVLCATVPFSVQVVQTLVSLVTRDAGALELVFNKLMHKLAEFAVRLYKTVPSSDEQKELRFTRGAVCHWLNLSGQWPREFGLLSLFARYNPLRTDVRISRQLATCVLGLEQVVLLSCDGEKCAQLLVAAASAFSFDNTNAEQNATVQVHTTVSLRAHVPTHWYSGDNNKKLNAGSYENKEEEEEEAAHREDAWCIVDPLTFLLDGGIARTRDSDCNDEVKKTFELKRGDEVPFDAVRPEGVDASPCGQYFVVSFANKCNGLDAEMCQIYQWPCNGTPIATFAVCPGGLAQARFLYPSSCEPNGTPSVEFLLVTKHGGVVLHVLCSNNVVASKTRHFQHPCAPTMTSTMTSTTEPNFKPTSEPTDAPPAITLQAAATSGNQLAVAVSTAGGLSLWNYRSKEIVFCGSTAPPPLPPPPPPVSSSSPDSNPSLSTASSSYATVIEACGVEAACGDPATGSDARIQVVGFHTLIGCFNEKKVALCWYTADVCLTQDGTGFKFDSPPTWVHPVCNTTKARNFTCWALTSHHVAVGSDTGCVALWCQKTGKLSGSVEVSSSEPVTKICFGTNVVAVAAGGQVHILTSKFKRVCRVNALGTTPMGLERAWVLKTTRTGVLRKTCWDDLSPDDEFANTTIALTNAPATNAASQKRVNKQQNLHQRLQKTVQDSEQAAYLGSMEADIVELVIAFVVLCQGKTNKDIHESTNTKRNDVLVESKNSAGSCQIDQMDPNNPLKHENPHASGGTMGGANGATASTTATATNATTAGATAAGDATTTGATATGVTAATTGATTATGVTAAIFKTKRLAGNGTEAAAKVVCASVFGCWILCHVLPVKLCVCVRVRACACVCVRVRARACVFVYL
jgi:hypothetical protein